jgi:cell division control protein 6
VLALSLTEKLVLLAVMAETGYGAGVAHTGGIYARYVELSRRAGVEPVTRRRVRDVIRGLAGMGILQAWVDSLGGHGRTTIVRLLAPPAALCRELTEDLLAGRVAEEVCGGHARLQASVSTQPP